MSPQQFSSLLSGFYAGTLSPEETQALTQVLHDPARQSELDSFFDDTLSARPAIDAPVTLDYVYRRVLPEQDRPVRRLPFLTTTLFRYAAAVLLLFATGTYLYLHHHSSRPAPAQDRKTMEADIRPGGNKATLQLANGSTIVLNSAANGLLAVQGNTKVVKNADGKIIYNPDGQPAGGDLLNTLATPRGGQYQLTLPDGTLVWLDAASSITYPAAFTGRQRTVKITGEAYFEVAKDKQKPFIVDVDGRSVMEVLGTHFNINSYPDESSVKMTLLEGSVKVTAPAVTSSELIMSPGQQAQLSIDATHTGQLKLAEKVDTEKVMAWKNGFFDLQGAGFPEVVRQLEKWYDIRVVYTGQIPGIHFKGYMDRGINLSGVLHLFSELGIKTTLNGRTLTVE